MGREEGILFLVSNQTFNPQYPRSIKKMTNFVVGIGRYIDHSKAESL